MLVIALEKKKPEEYEGEEGNGEGGEEEEEEKDAFGGFQYWGCSRKDFLKNLQLCVAYKN